MPVPDRPVPLAAEPEAVDEVHTSWVPVEPSVSVGPLAVPVNEPPPDTVHVPAADAGPAATKPRAAAAATPATSVLLVRVESLRTG